MTKTNKRWLLFYGLLLMVIQVAQVIYVKNIEWRVDYLELVLVRGKHD